MSNQVLNHTETIILGGGCFWCLEASYQMIRGVESVVPGYSQGVEVVQVSFNPAEVGLEQLLEVFWIIHDPTSRDRQGNDVGPQYRSIIVFNNEQQDAIIKKSLTAVAKLYDKPIVTEVVNSDEFRIAEAYHHNYFNNHPEQAYCQVIINPKLAKLRQKFDALLK